MMKRIFGLCVMIVFWCFSSGFQTFNGPFSRLLPTSLKITVIDHLGNVVKGATVTLYGTKEDYMEEKNPLFPAQDTNDKGIVKFRKLEPRPYYIHAIKGAFSNQGEGVLTDRLKEGRINKVNTIIQ